LEEIVASDVWSEVCSKKATQSCGVAVPKPLERGVIAASIGFQQFAVVRRVDHVPNQKVSVHCT
jgi:hypothetical protein